MRFAAITLLIIIGLYKSIMVSSWSLILFNWVTFMKPQDLDFSFWRGKPMFLFALAFLMFINIVHKNFRLKMSSFLILFSLLYFWIIVCCFFAFIPDIAWSYFTIYIVNYLPTFIIVSACINSLNDVKYSIGTMSISITLLAAKVGLSNTLSGGGRITDAIDGFVGDNNGIGLCVSLAIGATIGVLSMIENKYLKIALFICILLGIMTVLYTQSRGAFLTLAIIIMLSVIASKHRIRYAIIVSIIVITGYLMLPASMFERLDTLNSVEEDTSAMGRVDMWKGALKIAEVKPINGAGPGNFRAFNHFLNPKMIGLVTHSIYFQLLSDTGYVGLIIYLTIIISTLVLLQKTYSLSKKYHNIFPEYHWVEQVSFWLRNALIGYMFGSGLLDMVPFDIPWYYLLYASLLHKMFENELNEKIEAAENGEALEWEDGNVCDAADTLKKF